MYALRVGGGDLRRLTRFPSNAKRGDVSPDGRLVLFDGGSQRGGSASDFDVQVMHVDGGGRRTLAGTSSRELDARFSPDGRWVSYTKESPTSTGTAIWITRLDGKARRRLGSGASARWSPDSRHLVFSRSDGIQTDLYTMSVGGGQVSRLTHTRESEEPGGWSPDGRRILFTRLGPSADVYVMDANGRNVHRLTSSAGEELAGDWSPDGRWIAFTRNSRAYVMRADGTDARRVSRNGLDLEVTAWVRSVR